MMKLIREAVERFAGRVAIMQNTPARQKTWVVTLAMHGVISPSYANWLLIMNGLRDE